MNLGKMMLALDLSPQSINRNIPNIPKFRKEHWVHAYTPSSIVDILQEPLFLDELVTMQNEPLLFTNWIDAGLGQSGIAAMKLHLVSTPFSNS